MELTIKAQVYGTADPDFAVFYLREAEFRSEEKESKNAGRNEKSKNGDDGKENKEECTLGRMTMKSTRRALGHLLLRSLVRSHRLHICLLRTARLVRAPRCAHLIAHSRARGK